MIKMTRNLMMIKKYLKKLTLITIIQPILRPMNNLSQKEKMRQM